jgi:hypothetical protein
VCKLCISALKGKNWTFSPLLTSVSISHRQLCELYNFIILENVAFDFRLRFGLFWVGFNLFSRKVRNTHSIRSWTAVNCVENLSSFKTEDHKDSLAIV